MPLEAAIDMDGTRNDPWDSWSPFGLTKSAVVSSPLLRALAPHPAPPPTLSPAGDLRARLRATAARVADQPRIWILLGATGGDNAQLVKLARVLGWPFECKDHIGTVPELVAGRLLDAFGMKTAHARSMASTLVWPDLILLSGGRRVVDAKAIKEASGGRSKIVCIGRPWAGLDDFDLVVTTAQYGLPEGENVLVNPLTLNRPEPAALDAARMKWLPRFSALPRPWTALIVGGSSGSYTLDPATAARIGREASAEAARHGGSLFVSTSARTGEAAADALFDSLSGNVLPFRWKLGAAENPYQGFLALADRFIVSCDSASMIAEACSTGRPVQLARLRHSRWARLVLGLTGNRRSKWLQWMARKGYWVPPRDMGSYHARLIEAGRVSWLGDAEAPATPEGSMDPLPETIARIRRLFPGLNK